MVIFSLTARQEYAQWLKINNCDAHVPLPRVSLRAFV